MFFLTLDDGKEERKVLEVSTCFNGFGEGKQQSIAANEVNLEWDGNHKREL